MWACGGIPGIKREETKHSEVQRTHLGWNSFRHYFLTPGWSSHHLKKFIRYRCHAPPKTYSVKISQLGSKNLCFCKSVPGDFDYQSGLRNWGPGDFWWLAGWQVWLCLWDWRYLGRGLRSLWDTRHFVGPKFCVGPAWWVSVCPPVLPSGARPHCSRSWLQSTNLTYRSHEIGLDIAIFPFASTSGTKREEIVLLNLALSFIFFSP